MSTSSVYGHRFFINSPVITSVLTVEGEGGGGEFGEGVGIVGYYIDRCITVTQ